jgi:integrase
MGAKEISRADGANARLSLLSNDIVLYSLRHSYATWLHENGVCDDVIQMYMGHSSFKITRDNYIDVTDATVRANNDIIRRACRAEADGVGSSRSQDFQSEKT